MQTLTQNYQQQFAGQQNILSALTQTFEPILAAGPSQQGFSPAEATALNTQATEGVGQGYANLQRTLAQQQAARGGGNEFLPSGAQTQLQAELGTSAANQLSGLQNANLLANYAQGRANFGAAANALGGVAERMNPLGYAGQTTSAGQEAAYQANQVAAANNAWLSALGGALGGIVTGPLFGALGSGTKQSPATSGAASLPSMGGFSQANMGDFMSNLIPGVAAPSEAPIISEALPLAIGG